MQLRRSPGFELGEFPPIDNVNQGLNVVWGPNGVGKSTLVKAMRALIWKTKSSKDIDAEAQLETPDGPWRLELSQGEPKQTRLADNQTIQLPGRMDELSDSYYFPLHELLQVEEKGGTFLKRIQTAMQGGVDLSRACTESGGKSQFITSNCAPRQLVLSARNEVAEEQRKQAESRDIQQRIEELDKSLRQHGTLLEKQKLLINAIRIQELEANEKNLQYRLSEFPKSIANLQSDSPQQLEQLQSDVLKKHKDLLQSQEALQNLYIALTACKVPETYVDDLAYEKKLLGLQAALDKAKEKMQLCEKELLAAETTLDNWNTQYAWILPEPPQDTILPEKLVVLKHLANECEPLRCTVEADRIVARDLGPVQTESTHEPLIDLLIVRVQDWIQAYTCANSAPKGVVVPKNHRKKIFAILSCILLIITLLTLFVHPYSIFAIILALGLLWKLLPKPAGPDQNKELLENLEKATEQMENLFKRLPSYQNPSEWTPSICIGLLQRLVQDKQELASVRIANQKRKNAMETLRRSQEALLQWTAKWQAACEDLGVDRENPVLEGAQFYNFSNQLNMWVEMRKNVIVTEKSLQESRLHYQQTIASLQKLISTQETDPVLLSAEILNLVDRIHLARTCCEKIRMEELRLQTARENHKQELERLQAFWEKCGIEVGDVFTLMAVASQVELWVQTQRECKGVQVEKEKIIQDFPISAELAMVESKTSLDAELAEIESKLEKLGVVRENLGRCKQTYDQLLAGDSLGKALKKQRDALTDLENLRKKEVAARVIQLLTDRLSAEAERECQPEVLRGASDWLARITHARYALSVNASGFFAHDTIQGRTYTLDQLSSGTRVQVLFAVRMAFIEMQEQSTSISFPIFLDELLANSDDGRALAIVSSILEIAKERQVFYITAQQDEVEKLRQLSGVGMHEVPLERLKTQYEIEKHPMPRFTYSAQPVPKPIDDYYAYAELCQVPGADLWNPISSHHAWHLFLKSSQLYEGLARNLSTIAQVVNAMSKDFPGIGERYKIMQNAQSRAQDGRSMILRAEHLADEELTINRTAGFWKQTLEYVQSHRITGDQLLLAIDNKEISRFNDSSKNILRDWLVAHRFASETEALPFSDILTQIHVAHPHLLVDSEDSLVVQRWLAAVLGHREGC